jgi:hypothetical protein
MALKDRTLLFFSISDGKLWKRNLGHRSNSFRKRKIDAFVRLCFNKQRRASEVNNPKIPKKINLDPRFQKDIGYSPKRQKLGLARGVHDLSYNNQ